MYKAKVNGAHDFEITTQGGVTTVDNEQVDFSVEKIAQDEFHILMNNHSYNVQLISANRNSKSFTFEMEGREFDVVLEDDFDLLLDKMGIEKGAGNKVHEIKAPMPGLVLKVHVKDGDEVEEGDALVVLEAMKMENVIKAPAAAVVKSVGVSDGQKIDKNELLVSFE